MTDEFGIAGKTLLDLYRGLDARPFKQREA